MRKFLALLAVLVPVGLLLTIPSEAGSPVELAAKAERVPGVDLVVVDKSARELRLVSAGEVVRRFPAQLGDAPEGHKRREGDERTPEGRYTLDWRNPRSGYHLSIHVSYPNERDKAAATARGEDPGGMIMVHGQPNGWGAARHLLRFIDWTDGCIALSNEDMRIVWRSVPNGTPIDILP